MNKADLINYVAGQLDLTKKDAKACVEAVFGGVTEGLCADGKVTMVGFGSFVLVNRNARTARNPKTGEAVEVPAKVIPKFRPSASLKELFDDPSFLEDEGDDVDEAEEADEE